MNISFFHFFRQIELLLLEEGAVKKIYVILLSRYENYS